MYVRDSQPRVKKLIQLTLALGTIFSLFLSSHTHAVACPDYPHCDEEEVYVYGYGWGIDWGYSFDPAYFSLPQDSGLFDYGSGADSSREEEKKQCLADAQETYNLCIEGAARTHLTQYRLCEGIGWWGRALQFITRGRFGGAPGTCGPKLELQNSLQRAECRTDRVLNKRLCE